MPKTRPKYHFLTVVMSTSGKHIVALPWQSFGKKEVPWGVLVKDRRGKTIVANARRKAAEGDILFTTTLRESRGCLTADDVHRLEEHDNVFFADVNDYYQEYHSRHPRTDPVIENWWRHCGAYDRERASGIPYDKDLGEYLRLTDEWWDTLPPKKKNVVYQEFIGE